MPHDSSVIFYFQCISGFHVNHEYCYTLDTTQVTAHTIGCYYKVTMAQWHIPPLILALHWHVWVRLITRYIQLYLCFPVKRLSLKPENLERLLFLKFNVRTLNGEKRTPYSDFKAPNSHVIPPPALSDSMNSDDETSDIEILSDTEGGNE